MKQWLMLLVCGLLLVGCQASNREDTTMMNMRVRNGSSVDFNNLWLGVGGRDYENVAYGELAAGETSEYKAVPTGYHGYGKVNVTLATMERTPLIVVPAPDEGGPIFASGGDYTLIYEQDGAGGWQIRFEED